MIVSSFRYERGEKEIPLGEAPFGFPVLVMNSNNRPTVYMRVHCDNHIITVTDNSVVLLVNVFSGKIIPKRAYTKCNILNGLLHLSPYTPKVETTEVVEAQNNDYSEIKRQLREQL